MQDAAIAHLVLAHHQPAHLLRLVRRLANPRSFFFVHVDAKADVLDFEALRAEPRLTIVAERERVFWGGLSQVRAALSLLRAATRSGQAFRRYCLMSGADFPIKSTKQIVHTMLESDREFMRVDRKLTGTPRDKHFNYVGRFHWNDVPLFNPRAPVRPDWVHWLSTRAFAAARKLLPTRRFFSGLAAYQGAQWWSLTAACVRHILAFLDEHPGYMAFHRHVHVPDEIFFHSIVKASPFAEKISQDFEAGTAPERHHALHYIDWTARNVALPKTLDETDLDHLLGSEALFARKFDATKSHALIDTLESRIRPD